ncbi:single-stranded DNA-binding protein [Streptomyces hygroscopicus]|uniref:single-stranded DNA-binding protein n=1 Tax=Streptomyces hygroscopicus TaxID=1912 RepID=UPI0036360EBE
MVHGQHGGAAKRMRRGRQAMGEAQPVNESWVTVVGNAATRPDFWETAAGVAVARFRLAATVRRWDRGRDAWVDAYTSFYTVWAWRSLAANVAGSVSLGEPLVVHGTLRVRERAWDREGEHPLRGDQGGRGDRGEAALRGAAGFPGAGGGPGPAAGAAPDGPGAPGEGSGGGAQQPRRWVTAEIDAVAVGHDLTRGTSAFRRVSQAKPLLNAPTGATSL